MDGGEEGSGQEKTKRKGKKARKGAGRGEKTKGTLLRILLWGFAVQRSIGKRESVSSSLNKKIENVQS